MRHSFAALLSLFVAGCGTSSTPAANGDASVPDSAPVRVTVRLLGINDFHGYLQPSTGPGGALFGGAARLATHVRAARTPNSIFVSAGDLIGGSPLASGAFHDEPTVRVMNEMGLEWNGVGNHEFDEGSAELQRMQAGGCHPVDGCAGDTMFPGAKFGFLAANVRWKSTGKTLFPAYAIRDFGSVKLAIVGMTLQKTPQATAAGVTDDLVFDEEVATMTALLPELHGKGVSDIVLVVHQGGDQVAAGSTSNTCNAPTFGPIFDMAARMPSEVKVILSGHTHSAFNCRLNGKIVLQSAAQGHLLGVVDLTYENGALVDATANNETIASTDAPDPAVAAIVDKYTSLSASFGDQIVGSITADFDGGATGRVIADAMLFATAGEKTEIALMNTGGVRTNITYARSGPETADGQVRYAELFEVQPFGNTLSTVTLTGADIVAVLDAAAPLSRLVVSGLVYTQSPTAAVGSRVLAADVKVGGAPIDPAKTYRVVVNSIVADATTGYPQVAAGADPRGAGVDLDALVSYFKSHSPVDPPGERIFSR